MDFITNTFLIVYAYIVYAFIVYAFIVHATIYIVAPRYLLDDLLSMPHCV